MADQFGCSGLFKGLGHLAPTIDGAREVLLEIIRQVPDERNSDLGASDELSHRTIENGLDPSLLEKWAASTQTSIRASAARGFAALGNPRRAVEALETVVTGYDWNEGLDVIKTLGEHKVAIDLHPEVIATSPAGHGDTTLGEPIAGHLPIRLEEPPGQLSRFSGGRTEVGHDDLHHVDLDVGELLLPDVRHEEKPSQQERHHQEVRRDGVADEPADQAFHSPVASGTGAGDGLAPSLPP